MIIGSNLESRIRRLVNIDIGCALILFVLATTHMGLSSAIGQTTDGEKGEVANLSKLYDSLCAWSHDLQKNRPSPGAKQEDVRAFNAEYSKYSLALEAYKHAVSSRVEASGTPAALTRMDFPPQKGKMRKSKDVLKSEEALTTQEICTMLRSGFSPQAVVDEVKNRGLVEPVDPTDIEALLECGGTPSFVKELNNYNFILTDGERARYYARAEKRQSATYPKKQVERSSHSAMSTEDRETLKQLILQRQIIQNAKEDRKAKERREDRMDAETRRLWRGIDSKNGM